MKKIIVKAAALSLLLLSFSYESCAEEIKVIPAGRAVGIQIYTDGLLVIGTSEINGCNVAKEADIRVNDRITAVNGISDITSEEFAKTVNEHPDGVSLEITRDNRSFTVNAVPALSEDSVYRLGLWVRDSCAGVGTVTYYDEETNSFAALGHAINDVDTGDILSLKSGALVECDIVSVDKSKRGAPGEINASFGGEKLGEITINSPSGLFGKSAAGAFSDMGSALPVAAREQVNAGDAYILSDIFGNSTEKYSIKINKITNDLNKSLVIEVTDDRLLEGTGGIVQGMSGSPIIQNGYLVGAVTHVFVNNPSKGYGTLAENMIDTQRKKTAL